MFLLFKNRKLEYVKLDICKEQYMVATVCNQVHISVTSSVTCTLEIVSNFHLEAKIFNMSEAYELYYCHLCPDRISQTNVESEICSAFCVFHGNKNMVHLANE
jgi:hypothetical protein